VLLIVELLLIAVLLPYCCCWLLLLLGRTRTGGGSRWEAIFVIGFIFKKTYPTPLPDEKTKFENFARK